ncbi:MAG: hypothetical protein KA104_01830 [Candidatus Pacebacteria bacterium]|nr:hypothetical protein [Candidatus Paceibacterota bacterium]
MIRSLNQDFFKKWSSEMAYVLGFFAADGSMLRNGRGAHFIEFTSTDRVLIEHVQRVVGSGHLIKSRERGGRCKTAFRLQIGSKNWFEDLSKLGFTQHKSNELAFPEMPPEYFRDFVRGYFDGDGCVYFKSHFAKDRNKERWVFQTLFTSGSRVFLEKLLSEVRVYGVQGGRIATKSKSGYDLVFSWKDSLALYRLMYHTAKVADLYLPRKREKLEKAIQVLGLDNQVRS